MSLTEMESYRDLILENIEYDHLCREFTTYREDLDEIVELMVETVCAKRKTTRIAGSDFPHEVVRSRFLKLDCSHIEFVIYGRMIEIYLVTSVAPIPMATMMGKEWGGMGQNYLRSLIALGFQAFLIIVCVAIYAVLVQSIATESDIIMAIWSCVGYTVLLCFTLFKTGSLAKSVFNAH